MIIVRIQFDRPVTVPGKRPTDTIEPADPGWYGWEFGEEDGRLVIASPIGYLAGTDTEGEVSPTNALLAEIGANKLPTRDVRLVLTEPLSRVRLLCIDDVGNYLLGPSPALREARNAEVAARTKSNAEASQARISAKEANPSDRMAKVREAKAAKARAAKVDPKRPPWAGRDPVPPPSPPEEESGDAA